MAYLFLSPIAWDNSDGAHRPVQLAQELARRGHTVTYIEIEKSRTSPAAANPRVLNFESLGWSELDIVRAWYGMPYNEPPDAAARELDLPAEPNGVVLVCAPFRPALALLPALAQRGCRIVYDVLDDISEMRALGVYCYDDLAENYLVAQADLVVALSPRLRAKFAAHPNVVLIRDGLDLAPFRAAAAQNGSSADELRLARGEITVGFWGTMWDYNLDRPLLAAVTRARPTWQWHFIGAYDLDPARPSLARALAAPNVHFHPRVPRPVLARAARDLDVCILPTPVTPFNLARDPLKVYEYLAAAKPVVATALEQLAGMPHVQQTHSADEFLAAIERAAHTPLDRAALDAYLDGQTWAQRADALLAALAQTPARVRALPPPPRGAMPDAAAEPDRWQAFARHLERLAQDRDAHVADLERALRESGVAAKLKRALRAP